MKKKHIIIIVVAVIVIGASAWGYHAYNKNQAPASK